MLGNGTRIRTSSAPGTVIPPGPYLLIVKSDVPDEKDVFHLFHLSGAGVDMSSDLLPCENPREIYTINLRPNSTYVYEDGRHPELAEGRLHHVELGVELRHGQRGGGHSAGGYAGSVSNASLLGSKAVRGTLSGKVTAAGLTLSAKGKAVSLIKSGRYRVTVDDRTSKLGFTIAQGQKADAADARAVRRQAHGDAEPHAGPVDVLRRRRGVKHSFTVVA